VFVSTFRLMLHVIRASLDLGLKLHVRSRLSNRLLYTCSMLVLTHGTISVFPMDPTDSGRLLKVLFTLPVSSFGQTPLDSRFCLLESSREYWTCVEFLGENELARKCNEPTRIKSCGKTQRIQLVRSVLHFVAGGVRHQIRPI